MTALAALALADTGLSVRSATATSGPRVITRADDLAASGPHVLARVRHAVTASTRGIIVAAIGDPGVAAVRAATMLPVVGLGEASIRAASRSGRPFGMVTSTVPLGPGLRALVDRHATAPFTGLRFTASPAEALAGDDPRAERELAAAAALCTRIDGAEAVIVGGGPLSRAADALARSGVTRIVQPVPSAVAYVLDALGIRAPAR